MDINNKMVKVLELFSGTHSVGKVCKALGYDVVSVDIEQHEGYDAPTHKVNILDFDYKQYDHFDIIWASPPCTYYSSFNQCNFGQMVRGEIYTKEIWHKLMDESDKLVNKTLEIINHFNPSLWFMENPARSELKNREMMKDLPNYVVSYCKYCDWGYQKNTRIWTNNNKFIPKKCKMDCDNMMFIYGSKKHKKVIGGNKHDKNGRVQGTNNKFNTYKIPPKLIEDLLTSEKF